MLGLRKSLWILILLCLGEVWEGAEGGKGIASKESWRGGNVGKGMDFVLAIYFLLLKDLLLLYSSRVLEQIAVVCWYVPQFQELNKEKARAVATIKGVQEKAQQKLQEELQQKVSLIPGSLTSEPKPISSI